MKAINTLTWDELAEVQGYVMRSRDIASGMRPAPEALPAWWPSAAALRGEPNRRELKWVTVSTRSMRLRAT